MAKEALEKVKEQVNCSICLDTYTDPKLLQCFHVFCQKCLVPLVIRDQQGLTCPTCRQVTPIPAGGVSGLQPAFHINKLLEVKESLQKAETLAATPEGAVGGTTANAPSSSVLYHCFQHPKEELKLYCETCGELVCYECIMKGGKHHDHEYVKVNQAFLKYKEEIASSLDPMEKQVATIEKALLGFDTHCGELANQQAATEDSIHVTFKGLREVLNIREAELIDQLHQMTQQELKGLAAQRDQIETTLAQLKSCLLFMQESLKPGNERDVLMMKATTVKQVKELVSPIQADTLKPNSKADLVFSASARLNTVCQNYGKVLPSHLVADPSKCHATGKGVEVAAVGEKSTAILQAINFEGEPCEDPIMSLKCELESEITGTRASCSIDRRGQSQYEISYQPTIKGRHQLHIKVEGQHIRGSPFNIAAKSPVEKLGTPIRTFSGMDKPWGVAISQKGEVVVTEVKGNCVSVFSPSGQKIRSFGTRGSGQGQFLDPRGVAVDGEGNILVADSSNYRLQKFTAEGQFLAAVGSEGNGPLQFNNIFDIAINPCNKKIYILDTGNYRVQVLNSDLTFCTFGTKDSDMGKFQYSWGLACDKTGKVFVAENKNHRIQIFTSEGRFLRMFGRHGQGREELNWPSAVAIDTNNLVYVSEYDNHRISVFTSEGQFVLSFGKKGRGPGEFNRPRGLVVDDCGVVYVCDFLNSRVVSF